MTIRVGIVDSGINSAHVHVGEVKGGVFIHSQGEDTDYIDRIGHGTAVSGAIREKAPRAELYAVRIFERRLSATIGLVMRGLEWCLDHGMNVVNLSVGTGNEQHRPLFEDYLRRAAAKQVFVVSGAHMLPGSLRDAIPVAPDPSCERDTCRFEEGVFFASPYPRSIPGVPRERNLNGVSFAIANCSGLLAQLLESKPPGEAYQELRRIASSSNPFKR